MVQVNVITTSSGVSERPPDKPKLGFFVYILAFSAVIGGFLFGYDTGIVSSGMLYVPKNEGMKPLSNSWQEIIVSVTPGFAAVGALLSGPWSDRYGRKKIIIASSFIFTIGALICGVAIEKIMLVVGRVLLGVAIGFSSMIVPVYISEASPAHIRGTLVTGFQLMITFGLLMSNVIAGMFSYIDPERVGWRLMFGFAAIPAAIQFLIFFCLPESPRWLYENGYKEDAKMVLDKIYNGNKAWVDYELGEIGQSVAQNDKEGKLTQLGIIQKVWRTPYVRKALAIGCILQAFQQLSGINTIMYYAGKIIQSAGVRNTHTTIWISAAISAVNFVCTFIPMYLIDRVGRRVLLLSSMFGVAAVLLSMGGAFVAINRESPTVIQNYTVSNTKTNEAACKKYRNCDYCITDERCGFCMPIEANKGYCLPYDHSGPEDRSTTGFCMNGTQVGVGSNYEWSPSFCKTNLTFIPILLMVIYLAFFSIGYAPIPWVLVSEFFPLWARSTCVSLCTASNWIFNLIISLTFLSLSEALTKYGTFFLYGGITLLAVVFVWFAVPETKNCNIDEVEMLFKGKNTSTEQNVQHEVKVSNVDIVF